MVNLVLMQADSLDQIHVDLIGRGKCPEQIPSAASPCLGHCQDRWDVIAWMGVVCSQEGVMEVQFTHGRTIGKSCPFSRITTTDAKDLRSPNLGVGSCLGTCGAHRSA